MYPKRKTICQEIGLGEHSDLLITAYTKNYYKVLGFEKINLKEEEKKLLNKKEESFEDEEIIW